MIRAILQHTNLLSFCLLFWFDNGPVNHPTYFIVVIFTHPQANVVLNAKQKSATFEHSDLHLKLRKNQTDLSAELLEWIL